uniref:Uncharacterized protein n=1 Tax=Compsopogon caeruleus TaxID=31354 RepID=A0A7S1T5U8_9RHOD
MPVGHSGSQGGPCSQCDRKGLSEQGGGYTQKISYDLHDKSRRLIRTFLWLVVDPPKSRFRIGLRLQSLKRCVGGTSPSEVPDIHSDIDVSPSVVDACAIVVSYPILTIRSTRG